MNTPAEPPVSKKSAPQDLEVKDAAIIFNSVWKELEEERGRLNLRFPTELILLGGAPGAGKGTNTDYICEVRDISAPPIVVSQLLDSPEAQAIKSHGGMVGDREVVSLVMRELLKEDYRNGAILDGFPRTKVQVECLKMLHDHIKALRRELLNIPHLEQMKPPVFHIMVLFVDEAESVKRQLARGRAVVAHNEEVTRSGIGELWEERPTDFDEELARNRYRVFKEKTYDALVSLKQLFYFHFINAQAPLDVVQENILHELEYQSSLELDPRTFHAIGGIPLASEIVQHARRDLVKRLDRYEHENGALFHKVIELIESKLVPIVLRHAISGRATINTEDSLLGDTLALQMLIDVFSERGYHAVIDLRRRSIPARVNLETGDVICRQQKVYRISIHFKGSEIRRG